MSCFMSRQVKVDDDDDESHECVINNIMQKLFVNKLIQKLFLKISQQMSQLCRKLKWLLFFWDTVYKQV